MATYLPLSTNRAVTWTVIHPTLFKTVSANGIANGKSTIPNDGADYGPDTPGTTTSGIQEAVNATILLYGTCFVKLLAGNFVCSSKVDPTNGGTAGVAGGVFIGSGKRLSIIEWASGSSGTLFGFDQSTETLTDWTFSDFAVQGASAASAPLWQCIQKEGGARHSIKRIFCNENGTGASNSFYWFGAEDCIVEELLVQSGAIVGGVPAFYWYCIGGVLYLQESVLFTAEIEAAEAIVNGGALKFLQIDTAGVATNFTINGMFWNGASSNPINVIVVGSNKTVYLNLNNVYWSGEDSTTAGIHVPSTLVTLVLTISGASTLSNSSGTATKLTDATHLVYKRTGPTRFTNYIEPNIDNRTGLTVADTAPTSLGDVDTAAQTLYQVSGRVMVTAGTAPVEAIYALSWIEAGTARVTSIVATVAGSIAAANALIQPDNGTAVTAQLVTLTGTGVTANVAAELLPVAQ